MSDKQEKKGALGSFPGQYWLVIMFEFFERGSYYGMMSVLSVYLTDILGFPKQGVGIIKGTIQPILYFLPILSGALADRFGYRRTLMVAFALLGSGYFLTSQMTTYTAIFMTLCLMALGAGTFKPIISGSIARMTDEKNSTLGFGIYYWSINLGAFLFPLILVPFLKNNIGWDWVIIASALGTGAMLIPTLFFFKEPPKAQHATPQKQHNLLQTLANAFEIIYSPIVLIYHGLGGSNVKKILITIFMMGLVGMGLQNYLHQSPISEKLEHSVFNLGQVTLAVTVEPNVMQKKPYSIADEIVYHKAGKRLIASIEKDSTQKELFDFPTRDGNDFVLTLYSTISDSIYEPLVQALKADFQLTKSELDSLIQALQTRQNNQIFLTLYKPDEWDSFKTGLLKELQTHPPLANLSATSLDSIFNESKKTPTLTLSLVEDLETLQNYSIQTQSEKDISLSIFNSENYDHYKNRLLNEIREFPAYSLMLQSQLDELFARLQQRSFFWLFVALLVVTSLAIVSLQNRFNDQGSATKSLYILLILVLIGLVNWLLPGLTLFGRIVSTVIYLTVLSLFLIDSSDIPKFRDHFRFLLMVFIYSGFWILYFQMFDSVLWYVNAYVDASSLNAAVNSFLGFFGIQINWFFDVEHVTAINAGTIILLQLIVSNIVKHTKALPTMVVGILLGTLGMAILAISTGIWVFLIGIIIFSVGEMTAHPKFISYVGQKAPKERVATYMGYIFLYGVIGSSIGSILGANLYVHFVDKLHQPKTLWLIFAGIGVATIFALLIYNIFFPHEKETT